MRTRKGSLAALVLLGLTTVIFIGISSRFLINPVAAAAAQGISLRSAFGITTVRVGFGVFPLGAAIVAAAGLFSPSRRRDALRFISAVFSVALAVRVASVIVDHSASSTNLRLIAIEAVVLLACLAVLLFDATAFRKGRDDGLRPA
jgi:Domain of unknown function (DUF4345)